MLGESLGCLFVFVESLRLALEKERSEVCKVGLRRLRAVPAARK